MDTQGTSEHHAPQSSNTFNKRVILGLIATGLILLIILATGVFFAFGYIRRTIETTSLNIPLLANPPVTNQIAFVGDDDNLWLVSPDGDDLRNITEDGRGYRFPTWAPDGRRLAFLGPSETNPSALYISPTGSSDPIVVFDEPQSAPFYLYWAPDSNSITFLTQELSGLAMRQIDTRTPDMDHTLGEGAPFYWVWSPQSDRMLLHVGGSRADSSQAHISLLDNDQDAERVELNLAPGSFQAPVWSSNGTHFFYIATNNEGQESIFRTNAQTLEQVVITDLGGLATYLILSSNDRHIAYLQLERGIRAPFGKAYLANTDGKNHKVLTDDPVASMYWSPDGTKLALLSLSRHDEGPTAKLSAGLAAPLPQQSLMLRWWIYDVETEDLEPLISFAPTSSFLQTVPFFDQYHLSLTFWSPDSRYFVVTKNNDNSEGGTIWVVDTTGEEEPLKVGQGSMAVWSWQ